MTYEEVKRIVDGSRPGTFLGISWEKEIPIRAGFVGVGPIKKHSSATVRIGVNYDNMKVVQTKRADGTLPPSNQGLPWGRWIKFPYYIENNDGSKRYLRVSLDKNNKVESRFSIGGIFVPEQDVLRFVPKSALKSKYDEVLVISMDNIVEIRKREKL